MDRCKSIESKIGRSALYNMIEAGQENLWGVSMNEETTFLPGDIVVVKPNLRWSNKCNMLHIFLGDIGRPVHVIPLPWRDARSDTWMEVLRSDGKVLKVEKTHFEVI